MASFEMTDKGIIEVGDDIQASEPEAIISASAAIAQLRTPPTPLNAKASVSDLSLTQNIKFTKITPKTVIQAAKARVREIKAELRHHQALKTELFQLESLLKAAKALPKTASKTH